MLQVGLLRRKIPQLVRTVKNSDVVSRIQHSSTAMEIAEFKTFYTQNAKQGWQNGKIKAQNNDLGRYSAFFTKVGYSLKNTKVRKKDILPGVLGIVGSPIPIPGASPVMLALGFVLNKKLAVLAKKLGTVYKQVSLLRKVK